MGINSPLDKFVLNRRCLWLFIWQCWQYLHNRLGLIFIFYFFYNRLGKFNVLGNSLLLLIVLRQLENTEIVSVGIIGRIA